MRGMYLICSSCRRISCQTFGAEGNKEDGEKMAPRLLSTRVSREITTFVSLIGVGEFTTNLPTGD